MVNITVLSCEELNQYGVQFRFAGNDENGDRCALSTTAWLTPLQLELLEQAIRVAKIAMKEKLNKMELGNDSV